MRLKKAKSNKTSGISLRCKEREFNKIKQKANIYADGNVSEYMIYAAIHFIPGKEDFEDDEEPKKKKRK